MRSQVFISVLVMAGVFGCGAPPSFTAEDEGAIRELVAAWDQAFEDGDMAGAAALLNDQYVDMHAVPVVGSDARSMIGSLTTEFTQVRTSVERISGDGSLAYVWVSMDHRFSRGGEEFGRTGTGLLIARRNALGEWLFEAMSWHTEVAGP